MSRSNVQVAQSIFTMAPTGLIAKFKGVLAETIRFEPAAVSVYARNAEIRATGRSWLM